MNETDIHIYKECRNMPLADLALLLANRKVVNAQHILQQVEGWQRLRGKVPAWAETEGLEFPPRISLEQCSGQAAAEYKAQVVSHNGLNLDANGLPGRMADLTGGLGVDFSFLAPLFDSAVYVERQEHLTELARHNFPLLGLAKAEVVCADAVDFLSRQEADSFTLLFLDPARRDTAGRKTVLISDCEPDLCSLAPRLLEVAPHVVVKLSTMLDISEAVRSLGCVGQVHVTATGGECKDLLLVLSRGKQTCPLICINEDGRTFSLSAEEEARSTVEYADATGAYLYEPGPAVMKAGAFRWTAAHFALKKLHQHSHLYTGNELVEGFPGRVFRIEHTFSFSKADIKALQRMAPKANLAVRNFPSTVAELRRRLRIKEGGSLQIFATTLGEEKVLIVGERVR